MSHYQHTPTTVFCKCGAEITRAYNRPDAICFDCRREAKRESQRKREQEKKLNRASVHTPKNTDSVQ